MPTPPDSALPRRRPPSLVERIVVHHTATPDDDHTAQVVPIRWWHRFGQLRPFVDIGYHALVEKIGGEYQVVAGRALHEHGAHCKGHNITSVGMALVGNFEEGSPPAEMLEVAARHLAGWLAVFDLPPEAIVGHRDVAANGTLCPGRYMPLPTLRSMAWAYLLGGHEGSTPPPEPPMGL